MPPSVPDDLRPGVERTIPVACPDCSGVLNARVEGRQGRLVYRCRVGHTYSLGELLAGKEEQLEARLWSALATQEELIELLEGAARVAGAQAGGAMINAERQRRDVVVVGASAGGVEALRTLLAPLPADLAAAVAIVIHRSPVYQSKLPIVLGRRARLPVTEPVDGTLFEPGHVYAAPRDQHMIIEDGRLRLNRGPKEHHTRPAIDPLFRSAAESFGPRVVGVLLTGLGDDGVPGLMRIKVAGGLSMVQDPREAAYPTMPRSAIEDDDVDAILSLEQLAHAIVALAAGEALEAPRSPYADAPR